MRVSILLLTVLLAVAGPAHAGIKAGNGEVGFDLGLTNFDSEVSDDTGAYFDARGGYHFTDWFELEGQISGSTSTEESPFGDTDVTLATFMLNGVFNFHPAPEIVPYVLFGLGQANLELETPSGFGTFSIDDDGSAWQIAGGARFFVGRAKKMAVRVELSRLTEKTFDESSSHTTFLAGLTWRLGR